jgi:NAD+ kinase
MDTSKSNFTNIIVASHPKIADASTESAKIASFFNENGVDASYSSLYDEGLRQNVRNSDYDLLVALGGDGTMLRAGQLCAPYHVPILGINMGKFGFLMEIQQDNWKVALPKLLDGDYWLERRMMLSTEQRRSGEVTGRWEALNEAVVSRGQTVRPVQLTAKVDGRFLTTYVADGLIVATATGSTAYALAAGGPILPPELRTILIIPLAPHLSIDRAIVIAEGSIVDITVKTDHQAILSVDGQEPIVLEDGDQIKVYASNHSVNFVRIQDPGYFYRNLTPHMNQNPSLGYSR